MYTFQYFEDIEPFFIFDINQDGLPEITYFPYIVEKYGGDPIVLCYDDKNKELKHILH